MKARRMFPLVGCDPARVELWDTGSTYEVKRDGRQIWRSSFHSDQCYADAYTHYKAEKTT